MTIYAGFWIRVAAYLIDYVVLFVAQIAVFMVFGVSIEAAYGFDESTAGIFESVLGIIAYLGSIVISILYYVVMESSSKQGTLGKIALGLVVTDVQGNRISTGRALGRYFAKILSAMVLMIGYIMVAFTDRKQGLHDIVCSTYVLKGKPGQTGYDPSVFE